MFSLRLSNGYVFLLRALFFFSGKWVEESLQDDSLPEMRFFLLVRTSVPSALFARPLSMKSSLLENLTSRGSRLSVRSCPTIADFASSPPDRL